MLMKVFSTMLAPAIIEELVTPYLDPHHDSWGVKVAKILGFGITSSFAYVRDIARALINMRDPQIGLQGETVKELTDLVRDWQSKGPKNKEWSGRVLKHTYSAVGILSGMTNAQEGKLQEYLYRYENRLEKPKGPWSVAVGTRFGTTKHHSVTFNEWWDHTFGGKR
jgi:hypothetical protein